MISTYRGCIEKAWPSEIGYVHFLGILYEKLFITNFRGGRGAGCVVPVLVSEKGYKETVQVAESTILVVSKAQSRICNESLLYKAYCIYWIIAFRTPFFWKGGCDHTRRTPLSHGHANTKCLQTDF